MNEITTVYFDVNRTIIVTDQASGKDLDGILQSALAWNTKAEWSQTSGCVNFHHYLERERPEVPKKDRHEILRRFVEVELPAWRSPLTGEPHPELGRIQEQFERAKKLMQGRYFVPAFTHFVTRCEQEGKNVRIVFRTFGHDIPEVTKNFLEAFPQRRIAEIARFEGHALHSSNGVFSSAAKVHEYVMGLKGDAAIRDDWKHWSEHGESRASGKLFPIGRERVFFFDDNITGREDKDIVCPVDAETGETLSRSDQAILVDTVAAIEDPDYFYNHVFS